MRAAALAWLPSISPARLTGMGLGATKRASNSGSIAFCSSRALARSPATAASTSAFVCAGAMLPATLTTPWPPQSTSGSVIVHRQRKRAVKTV